MEELKTYIIFAQIPSIEDSLESELIKCWNKEEAIHLAKDKAWDLYFKYEGKLYDLPSYEDLEERYHAEWFDLIDSEFERALDDLYIRTIQESVDYWVEEAK
jgi:hypothetical protein